ncbi:MAG TPA: hypothetical protein VJW55_11030 [Candidatus Angelobacter sp.]|nr:hypothetical protein [Candidatus Angelobacter sp.]
MPATLLPQPHGTDLRDYALYDYGLRDPDLRDYGLPCHSALPRASVLLCQPGR